MNKPIQSLWKTTRLGLLVLLVSGCSTLSSLTGGLNQSPQKISTAPVQIITAVSMVSGSGTTQAIQSLAVNWKTIGIVGTVNVKVGDQIKTGDVLMTINPQSEATAILQAQAQYSSAVQALTDLLHPSEIKIAEARQAVADAQTSLDDLVTPTAAAVAKAQQALADAQVTLKNAEKTLGNSQSVNISYYQDQVAAAQDALTNAQQNTTVTDIGSLTVQLRQAQTSLATATNIYNNAKDAFADCPACEKVWAYDRMTNWADAQNLYTDAVNQVTQLQIQIDQAQRSNSSNIASATDSLTTAARDLKWAQTGSDVLKVNANQAALSVAQAAVADAQTSLQKVLTPDPTKVALAKATLADAQNTLAKLMNPNPTDVVNAQAKVASAKDTLDAYSLKAPVEGEVLEVNFKPGDRASSATAAVTLVNRSFVEVKALVDEAQVAQVKVGNPVTLTLNAVPGLSLPAQVTYIDATGVASQGLVKYSVQVDSTWSDPRVLLGMTADVLIVTNTQTGALAVPMQALQYDASGEFVNTVAADGVTLTRVPVVSGQIQDAYIVVSATLKSGELVELPVLQATTSGFGAFGGGPGGATP